VERLRESHLKNRTAVITAVLAKRRSAVLDFADAFRVKKDRDDG
jgi:hypothetical protein